MEQITERDEIGYLYSLIRTQPHYLKDDQEQFFDTPLHLAAAAGQTVLALEILRLMPSFGRKPNPDGFTPLLLALQGGHTQTALAMAELDPELVGVQGRGGITPLIYMAETDDVDMLAEFLTIFPNSIDTRTTRRETAVHVAVKNGKLAAFMVLFGWLRRNNRKKVLRWKDWEGNNVLHLAAATSQPMVIELLVKELSSINEKNSKGQTALDIVRELPIEVNARRALKILGRNRAKMGLSIPKQKSAAEILSSEMTINDRVDTYRRKFTTFSSDERNILLTVACLLAAATYQAVINPPGDLSGQAPFIVNITSTAAASSTSITPSSVFTNTGADTLNARGAEQQELVLERDYLFLYMNTIVFMVSTVIIQSMIPSDGKYNVFNFSLIYLVGSYIVGFCDTLLRQNIEVEKLEMMLHLIVRICIWSVFLGFWKYFIKPLFRHGPETIRQLIHLVTSCKTLFEKSFDFFCVWILGFFLQWLEDCYAVFKFKQGQETMQEDLQRV